MTLIVFKAWSGRWSYEINCRHNGFYTRDDGFGSAREAREAMFKVSRGYLGELQERRAA